MIYRETTWRCAPCDVTTTRWQWDVEGPARCPQCQYEMAPPAENSRAASVIGDDIPGGIVLDHVAFRDGVPQRFYSKRAATDAAMRAGWTRYGETPKDKRHREV